MFNFDNFSVASYRPVTFAEKKQKNFCKEKKTVKKKQRGSLKITLTVPLNAILSTIPVRHSWKFVQDAWIQGFIIVGHLNKVICLG